MCVQKKTVTLECLEQEWPVLNVKLETIKLIRKLLTSKRNVDNLKEY